MTARTVRAAFRAKGREPGLSERDSVAKSLNNILGLQAKTVEDLAQKEAMFRGPRERNAALGELSAHDHWVDFADPSAEADRSIPFVERGLGRGAKVIALLPPEDVDRYEQAIVRSGHKQELDWGQIALFNIGEHLNALKTAGLMAVLFLAIQGMILGGKAEGYAEVWFIGKIASALLPGSQHLSDLALRVESALDTLVQIFPIALYCPYPDRIPAAPDMTSGILRGHTWSAMADDALALAPRHT